MLIEQLFDRYRQPLLVDRLDHDIGAIFFPAAARYADSSTLDRKSDDGDLEPKLQP